jgi:hypothetical protein
MSKHRGCITILSIESASAWADGTHPTRVLKKIPQLACPAPPHTVSAPLSSSKCATAASTLALTDRNLQKPLKLPHVSHISGECVVTFIIDPAFETVHRDVCLRVPCSFVRIPTLDLGPLSLWDGELRRAVSGVLGVCWRDLRMGHARVTLGHDVTLRDGL